MPNQRGYDPDWFLKGFTWEKNANNEVIPICFICSEKKSTNFMRDETISKHFEAHKKKRANTDRDTIEKLYDAWCKPKTLTAYRIGPETDKSKLASIIMSKHIARCKLPHTIAEDFLIPCMLDIMNALSPGKVVQMVEDMPKSSNTVQQRMSVWKTTFHLSFPVKFLGVPTPSRYTLTNLRILHMFASLFVGSVS